MAQKSITREEFESGKIFYYIKFGILLKFKYAKNKIIRGGKIIELTSKSYYTMVIDVSNSGFAFESLIFDQKAIGFAMFSDCQAVE